MKHIFKNFKAFLLAASVTAVACTSDVQAQQRIQVEITNNAPTNGVVLTPLWTGFHDGSFSTFTGGTAASAGLESIAEDGQVGTLSGEFNAAVAGGVDANINNGLATGSASGPPPIQPGETESSLFDLATDGSNNFLSFASMVLISNDFFIGNSSAIDISSVLSGGGPITIPVASVYDAGTEVEDFAFTATPPFFELGGGQTGPNQSGPVADTGLVSLLPSTGDPFAAFANAALLGPDGVPAAFNFNNADLYQNGIATITISAVAIPEPTSLTALLAMGTCGLLRRRR